MSEIDLKVKAMIEGEALSKLAKLAALDPSNREDGKLGEIWAANSGGQSGSSDPCKAINVLSEYLGFK